MNKVKYYRKKPVVIQAYQTDKVMYIETLEGTHKANVGDFIITGVHGEQYPCKPDIFQKTYQQVTEKDYLALKDKPIYSEIIFYSKEEYENYKQAVEDKTTKRGCELCNNDNLSNVGINDNRIALWGGNNRPEKEQKLKYCPNCGRKLED